MNSEEKSFLKTPTNLLNHRKIHRLEIPFNNKESQNFTFLILPSKTSSQTDEKTKNLRIVLLEDEIPGLLVRKRPHKTRKFIIKGLNSLSLLKTNEENILSNSLDSPNISSVEEIRPPLMNENQKNNDENNEKKVLSCKCKKSHCLKLYCECFLAQQFCSGDCTCLECSNLEKFEEKRNQFIEHVKEKNPLAFTPKIAKDNERFIDSFGKHNKGCNCRKSNCVKKYCECFQAGVKCTDLCKCDDCKNSSFFNKNCLFLRKPLQNLGDEFSDKTQIIKHLNNTTEFPDENAFDKRMLISSYSKPANTTKHQLNSFNSFHKVLKEEKDVKMLNFLKEKEKNDDDEWNWEFNKGTFKKTL